MKILNYYIISFILKLHKNNPSDIKETAIWGILFFENAYLILIVGFPLVDIMEVEQYLRGWTDREISTLLVIPLIIFDLFYFFWDERWLKLFEKVKEWPVKKRKKQRNILIGLLLILTVLSIVYQYYNFSFGRW